MSLKDRGVKLPLAMGHEIVGRVAAFGPDAIGVKVGDLRVVYPWVGCGECEMCRAEHDNMCLNGRALGIFQNGGYAEYVLVPEPRHLVDPGTLDPSVAATYACSGITVFSAVKKVLPLLTSKRDAVVIIGAGGLGLNAIAVLRALGHEHIVSVDVSAEKREGALAAGATSVVDGAGEGVAQRIIEAAGGPVHAVIDLVNGSQTARAAYDALTKGGRSVQVGLFGGEITIALPVMAMREITIGGSYVGSPKELRELIRLAQDGGVAALPVEEVPQAHANEALMRLRDGRVRGRIVLVADAA